MGVPIIIDTDMGADDAVAVTLALCAEALDVLGLVSVGGNVDVDQSTRNAGRLLQAIDPLAWPRTGRGEEQNQPGLIDARWLFGQDGLGDTRFPQAPDVDFEPAVDLYGDLIDTYGKDLVVVAIGPLTNLARLWEQDKERFAKIGRLVVMGGAIWCPGNVDKKAEFNFYRDPDAASIVLSAGVPITLVPLDVTRQVVFDDSHRARMAASGTRAGAFLDQVLADPLASDTELGAGRLLLHDAVAIGSLLWPKLFLQTTIAVEVDVKGEMPGRTKPGVGKSAKKRANVLVSVNAADFLENMIELLCQEKFIV